MVKANPHHDYYKDLECKPTAEDSDIRKQYHHLARIYHPDRNLERAQEYTPKFQAIQEAYEILKDPVQRIKYDQDRQRLLQSARSVKQNATPTRRNGYTATSEATANAPKENDSRRPQPQHASRTDSAKPSSGAARFSNFQRPPQQPVRADAQSKSSAWQRMNPPHKQTNTGKVAAEGTTPGKAHPPPRPGAFGRSQTSRPAAGSRKPGFDPNAKGPGTDERQASGNSGYFTSRYANQGPPSVPVEESQPGDGQPTVGKEGGRTRSASNVPFLEGNERLRTPYETQTGEQTYFSTDELKRSSSVRDAVNTFQQKQAAKGNFNDTSRTSSRHRSVSPLRRNYFENPPPNMAGYQHMPQHTAREKMKATDRRRFFDIGYPDTDDEDVRSPTSASHNINSETPSHNSPVGTEPPRGFNRPKAQPSSRFSRAAPVQPPGAEFIPTQDSNMKTSPSNPAKPLSGSSTRNATSPMYDDSHYSRKNTLSSVSAGHMAPVHVSPFFSKISTATPKGGGVSLSSSARQWTRERSFGQVKPQATGKIRLPSWAIPSTLPPRSQQKSNFGPRITSVSEVNAQLQHSEAVQPTKQKHGTFPVSELGEVRCRPRCSSLPFNNFFAPTLLYETMQKFDPADLNSTFSLSPPRSTNEGTTAHRWREGKSKSDESINAKLDSNNASQTYKDNSDAFNPPPTHAKVNGRGLASSQMKAQGFTNGGRLYGEVESAPSPANDAQRRMSIPDVYHGVPIPPPPGPPPSQNANTRPNLPAFPPNPTEVRFSKDEWQNKFQEPSWAYPQPGSKATSPTRSTPNQSRKGSSTSVTTRGRMGSRGGVANNLDKSTSRPATLSQNAAINEDPVNRTDKTGSTTGYEGNSSDSTSRNSDVMDIDEEPLHAQASDNTQPKSSAPPVRVRGVPLQAQRPDWRDTPSSARQSYTQAPPKAQNGQSSIDLDPLAKVAPFTSAEPGTPGLGLNSTAELSSSLPFPSGTSVTHPLKPAGPQTFNLPHMPVAPAPPGSGRLNAAQWGEYRAKFATFMRSWAGIEDQMLRHFDSRRCDVNDFMRRASAQQGGLEAWLAQQGETKDEVGWASYLRSVREDEKVRVHWNLLMEKHRDAVEAFAGVREKVAKEGLLP